MAKPLNLGGVNIAFFWLSPCASNGNSIIDASKENSSRFFIIIQYVLEVNIFLSATNIRVFFHNITKIGCFSFGAAVFWGYFNSVTRFFAPVATSFIDNCDTFATTLLNLVDRKMESPIRHTLKVVLTLVLLMVALGNQAGQAQTIRDKGNSMLVKVDSDGTVRNRSNSMVARIGSNGEIRDTSNRLLGKVSDDGTVRDSNNSYLGKIESDGTVRNRSNSRVGKIDHDGTVRNTSNSVIGHASGVPIQCAAIYFFFDFF